MTDELTWMPAWKMRELIGKGDISPVEVTEHFLGRIEEFDSTLKTFRTLDAVGARAQAREAEAAVRRGDALGSLHGIPFSVKEHIAVAGMPLMGAGFPEPVSTRDALGIQRLRDAGGIVFGTNTMMYTNGLRTGPDGEMVAAFDWDAEARNPWDTTRVPGWSSSGGAAATAARLIPLAVGTDGGGSTRLPAAYSGVFGLHPTTTLIPWADYDRPQVAPMMMSMGPLARHVVDAAIMLQAMAGPDGRDMTCIQTEPPDYLADIQAGVEGMRLAWTGDYGFTAMYAQEESSRVIAAVAEAADGFAQLGATVTSTPLAWEDFFPGFVTATYLYPTGGARPPRPTPEAWEHALDSRKRNYDKFRDVLKDHDVLLSPTTQLLPRTVEEWAANWTTDGVRFTPHGAFAPVYTSHTHMFNWLGFPAASVPCGYVDGLPIGLQVVALPGHEAKILRVAAAFQQAFPRLEHPPTS
jgi:Asp-tRNA(Asn)/Glu-tRNA(Gln) amidotransferase A subunit family amidase